MGIQGVGLKMGRLGNSVDVRWRIKVGCAITSVDCTHSSSYIDYT